MKNEKRKETSLFITHYSLLVTHYLVCHSEPSEESITNEKGLRYSLLVIHYSRLSDAIGTATSFFSVSK